MKFTEFNFGNELQEGLDMMGFEKATPIQEQSIPIIQEGKDLIGGYAVLADFIEQEWQKADEQELVGQYNRNREFEDHVVDVTEIERHRGLIIGEDGTVKSLE